MTAPSSAAMAALVVAAALASPSLAYEIYPARPVHEAMTRLSYQCLRAAGGAEPLDCRAYLNQIEAQSRWSLVRSFSAEEKAASWPDDPQREIGPWTIARFTLSVGATCGRDAPSPDLPAFDLAPGGLGCSSHWGGLQFFHAMASSENETPGVTRVRILDWAEFTFGTATSSISTEEDYCGWFLNHPSTISRDLAPQGFNGCRAGVIGSRAPAWRVSTLFTQRCGNPLFATNCSEQTGPVGVEETRRAALGALLHLIQDSYSQSHAKRGPGLMKGFDAVIVCAPPTAFLRYAKGTKTGHGQADSPPSIDPACLEAPPAVHDPITAGARALWMARRGADPAALRAYLAARVFPLQSSPA